jgi:valyl-tRNA synthetase
MFETKEGSDVVLTDEKMIGMRNFGNKIWNIGRFIYMNRAESQELKVESTQEIQAPNSNSKKTVEKLEKEFEGVKKTYHKNMEGYKFGQVLGDLHAFVWHGLADVYIEELKEELKNGNMEVQQTLEKTFLECLRMLHPFIPFETEALWQVFKGEGSSILEINK